MLGVSLLFLILPLQAQGNDSLEAGFAQPPQEARLRAYWWWLNGNVTKESITRDLEEMAAKGFGGALICDAGGAEQDGNDCVPHGPTFFTPAWRELYKHTLAEADRLGLEMSLSIQSGWNLGGPMVKVEDAPKRLVWSETQVNGPAEINQPLTEPQHPAAFYRDIAVLAYPIQTPASSPNEKTARLKNWEAKALHQPVGHFSAPDTSPLLDELQPTEGEENLHSREVVDLTSKMDQAGLLRWQVPAGQWEILRIGCTLNHACRVSTCSDGWQGYALDPFDANAFRTYWDAVVEPLIADAGPLAGRVLKYLNTDSWEVEVANWTPTLREEFRTRRGYDLWPFLPALAGRIVDNRTITHRFLHDFRKTIGDLAIDNHYQLFRDGAYRHGLLIHPESGGPHAVPIDSLRCLGMDDAPMSEFWARSWRHRVGDANRFFVKQPASAAHTYGRRLVLAEGFTTIGPHWQETLWDNLKPSFDRACGEGLNRLVWHAFVCSPAEMGMPGQQYFAGVHLNPNSTWWSRSAAFFAYLNRCQFMLQQGLFVADAVYYYGDHVPNFTQLKQSDPAHVLPGYDYDVATEEVVLTRMAVRNGRIVLPDGISYRVLVLPNQSAISLPVLRKLRELVFAGATVIGPKPISATGLGNYPPCDIEVAQLATELWGNCDGKNITEHSFGRGRIIWGKTTRQVLAADGVPPDMDNTTVPATSLPRDGKDAPTLDYIHRRNESADIYFVFNRTENPVAGTVGFRVEDRQPELWDAVTGTIRNLPTFTREKHRTAIPLEFGPYGSCFIVFRHPIASHAAMATARNFPSYQSVGEITGSWSVQFDPQWATPSRIEFPSLISWTQHPEDDIRFYAGTATYRKTFDLPAGLVNSAPSTIYLNLGQVRELAEVRLNGKNLGVLWNKPFRVNITPAVQPTQNVLEIDVVNFWPNRLIGDQQLPVEQRRTRTNIRKFTQETPLSDAGLLGPVTLEIEQWSP